MPLADQRIVVVGFGSAGLGIANLLAQLMREPASSETPRSRFYAVDRDGLLVDGMRDLRPAQTRVRAPDVRSAGGSLDDVDAPRASRPC